MRQRGTPLGSLPQRNASISVAPLELGTRVWMIAVATPGADSLSEGMSGRFRIGPKRRRLVAGGVLGAGRLAGQLPDVLDRL